MMYLRFKPYNNIYNASIQHILLMDNETCIRNASMQSFKMNNQNFRTDMKVIGNTIANLGNAVLSEFVLAIKENNLSQLNNLLKDNSNVHDKNGVTPLTVAVLHNNVDAVKIILPVSNLKTQNLSILSLACEMNNTEILKEILKMNDIDINKKGGCFKHDPLTISIIHSNTEIVELLLKKPNINVNSVDAVGITPLIRCIYNKQNNIMSLLLNHPAIDINAKDAQGNDPVMVAVKSENNHFFEKVIENNKFKALDKINECFIHIICNNLINPKIIENFSPFVNVNYQDLYKNTPLIYTCLNSNCDKVKLLLDNDAIDLSISNEFGMNALMCAISKGNIDCVKLIVDCLKRIDDKTVIKQVNNIGDNALLLAAKINNDGMTKILCNDTAIDINCINIYGETALIRSIKNGNKELFKMLIENDKIDINKSDCDGMAPLMHAIMEINNTLNCISVVDFDTVNPLENTHVEFTLELLKHPKIEINKKNNYGHSVLLMLILRKYGINYNKLDKVSNNSPFVSTDMSSFPDCFNYRMGEPTNNETKDKVLCNDYLISKLLKREDIDLNVCDNSGHTPFLYICKHRDVELFNLFINNSKLDINMRDINGKTCLMHIVELLLKNKDVATYKPLKKDNCIMGELNCDSMMPFKMDVSSGVKEYCSQQPGRSFEVPLALVATQSDYSCSSEYTQYFYLLTRVLDHPNIDLNVQDVSGNSVIMYLYTDKSSTILQKLIDRKININLQNYNGFTALMVMTQHNIWTGVELLIKHGADPDIKNSEGKYAQDFALSGARNIYLNIINKYKGTSRWFN